MTKVRTNKDRANKIKKLLDLQDDEKAEYVRVADVICDLRHYCDLHKIDWQNEWSVSEEFYDDEIYLFWLIKK